MSRLESSMRTWPQAMRRDFRVYIRRFQCSPDAAPATHETGARPYWLLLPVWLAAAYNKSAPPSGKIRKRTLNDVLWGQYCIFLSVRITDDLFDRQASSTTLLFAADQFMADGCNILFGHAGHSGRFRRSFTKSLNTTLKSIIEVDTMQRRARVPLKAMRAGHARVSSIFKIGSAAVCRLADRWRDFSRVDTACDKLAIAGQIIDDFQDIDEDLRDGRINYAARFLLGTTQGARPESGDTRRRLARRLLFSNRTDRLVAHISEHVQAAHDDLAPLRLGQTEAYCADYQRSLERMRGGINRERLRQICGVDSKGTFKNRPGTK
jgi:hypothetical protein